MVPARTRHHAATRLLLRQGENRICCPPNLERPRLLQIFALEKQPRPSQFIKGPARQYGRPVNPRPDPFVRPDNRLPIQGRIPAIPDKLCRSHPSSLIHAPRFFRCWPNPEVFRIPEVLPH